MLVLKDITDVKVLEHISEQLPKGTSLSRIISESLDLSTGTVKAFLPPEVTEVKNFYNGGILPQDPNARTIKAEDGRNLVVTERPDATAELTELIENYLILNANNFCIFEDAVSDANDGWLSSSGTNVATFDREVYHWLSNTAEKEKICNTIKRAQSWRLLGCLTSFPDSTHLFANKIELTKNDLDILAANITQLIVDAFDGESYLLWHRET